jgi:hypothetical protein
VLRQNFASANCTCVLFCANTLYPFLDSLNRSFSDIFYFFKHCPFFGYILISVFGNKKKLRKINKKKVTFIIYLFSAILVYPFSEIFLSCNSFCALNYDIFWNWNWKFVPFYRKKMQFEFKISLLFNWKFNWLLKSHTKVKIALISTIVRVWQELQNFNSIVNKQSK